MYFQGRLKRAKRETQSETGGSASAHCMKLENIVDEVELSTSSTLLKEGKTAISVLIKMISSV